MVLIAKNMVDNGGLLIFPKFRDGLIISMK